MIHLTVPSILTQDAFIFNPDRYKKHFSLKDKKQSSDAKMKEVNLKKYHLPYVAIICNNSTTKIDWPMCCGESGSLIHSTFPKEKSLHLLSHNA